MGRGNRAEIERALGVFQIATKLHRSNKDLIAAAQKDDCRHNARSGQRRV
jgi:hypothetical protein